MQRLYASFPRKVSLMCCKNSWKTDGDLEQLSAECICYKWFRRTCGICILVCFVAVVCCAYCTYVLFSLREIGNSCTNHQRNMQSNSDKNMQQDSTKFQMDIKSQFYDQVKATNDRHVYNNASRFKRAKESKKKCKCPKMLAGHYEQKSKPEYFTGMPEYTDTKMISPCKDIDTWNGTLCKAGDFKSKTKTLQVFQLGSSQKAKSSPFKKIENGKFITKKKGTYLVYAQVSFYDSKEFQQMKVIHRKKGSNKIVQEYACVRGVHNIDKSVNNTCLITALYFLNKGDYLTVDLSETDLNLNFLSSNTFFGAILLR